MKTSILNRVYAHYLESLNYFSENQIVGCFLQGSQNYKLDYENSDVDTKLIVVPTLKEVCLNAKPVSSTHARANSEHIDFKDIRLYIETFRKQNLNFLEILFTDYLILPSLYAEQWSRLIAERERVARMNPVRAVKSMKGIAMEKFHAMERRYPTKIDIIDKFGYDGKQVSHLIRVENFLEHYINGEPYKDCIIPSSEIRDRLLAYKRQEIPLEEARVEATETLARVEALATAFSANRKEEEDQEMRELLNDVCYNIMKISIEKELHA